MTETMPFDAAFEALTGHPPFPWQRELFNRFTRDDIPSVCDIPTGLGKTAVIPIWLIALARHAVSGGNGFCVPRRLVYVVNRRTVVDQATDVVESMQKKLSEGVKDAGTDAAISSIAHALRTMAPSGTDGEVLAVSTLRGELADNQKWRYDPRCPAIVVGTVDMVGSKLLFSGYGDSRRTRPLHAGILGCDTLFVHDEAHLTPAFGKLLRCVARQPGGSDDLGPATMLRVIELSATHLDSGESPHTIGRADRECPEVRNRLHAKKSLYLSPVEKFGKAVNDEIVRLALGYHEDDKPERVVVFVRFPKDATAIAERIAKGIGPDGQDRVSILTGEIRGYERDGLFDKPGRPGMLPFAGKEATHTVYLVANSAGEVGMDLHADQMVCDLTTLDSMIQRLGRVNRFAQTKARIDLVHEHAPKEEERQRTLEILQERQENGHTDVCPAALAKLLDDDNAAAAFSPKVETVELTDILTDLFAQTSLDDIPACPEVAPWLHGIQDDEFPETWIAWRKEVRLLVDKAVDDEATSLWFRCARVGSQERLRMPTHRFVEWLRNKDDATPWVREHAATPVVVLSARGKAQRATLGTLSKLPLNYATVLFPTELGALNAHGFFDVKVDTEVLDVASPDIRRVVLERHGNECSFSLVDLRENVTNAEPQCEPWQSLRVAIQRVEAKTGGRVQLRLKIKEADECEDDDEVVERWLLLLRPRNDRSPKDSDVESPTVDQHNTEVARLAEEMASTFQLSPVFREVLRLGGLYHDLGKNLDVWQIAAGYDPTEAGFQPRAKPPSGGFDWRKLDRYRHELGSVIEAEQIREVREHPERDLVLHLIATHHGWARPHFEEDAFPPGIDRETRDRIQREVMLRYVRLQERFGHWRLAWLESLLRRADGITSAQYDATATEEEGNQ